MPFRTPSRHRTRRRRPSGRCTSRLSVVWVRFCVARRGSWRSLIENSTRSGRRSGSNRRLLRVAWYGAAAGWPERTASVAASYYAAAAAADAAVEAAVAAGCAVLTELARVGGNLPAAPSNCQVLPPSRVRRPAALQL